MSIDLMRWFELELPALNAEAAERYKAITPPIAPEQAVPGSDDLAEVTEPES